MEPALTHAQFQREIERERRCVGDALQQNRAIMAKIERLQAEMLRDVQRIRDFQAELGWSAEALGSSQ
jgi:hypothetical protein